MMTMNTTYLITEPHPLGSFEHVPPDWTCRLRNRMTEASHDCLMNRKISILQHSLLLGRMSQWLKSGQHSDKLSLTLDVSFQLYIEDTRG